MSDNLPEFKRQLALAIIKLRGRTALFQQALTLEAHRRVVMRTPVDTGRARGNWQVSIGLPARGVLGSRDRSGAATVSRGLGTIKRIDGTLDSWVVNNVVYIRALEYGHSKQAPNGMVRVTIEELRSISDRLIGDIANGRSFT